MAPPVSRVVGDARRESLDSPSRRENSHVEHDITASRMVTTEVPRQRALLVGVEVPGGEGWALSDSLSELRQLASSAGLEVVGEVRQRLESPNPSTYVGKGKAQELVALRRSTPYDILLFDEELSPSQQRNLEDVVGVQVVDRTGLILDIFAQRARTHEGRLQVELAQYDYYLPRLTRMWTHLSRQTRGGVGLRGPGETQLESDRRRIRKRMSDLRRQLEDVRTHRALHREHRRAEMVPVVALVGYTNAGKSTLLRTLTGAQVLVEDRLFATLDPTTRKVRLPRGQEVLVTDTVGFIQKLPTQLVAAFRATLEELQEADLLIHVVDITHPSAPQQAEAVAQTLGELGVADKPIITALNKIDRLVSAVRPQDSPRSSSGQAPRGADKDDWVGILEPVRRVAAPYPRAVAISASEGIGIDDLLAHVEACLSEGQLHITVLLPYDASEVVASLHRDGAVLDETYARGGTRLRLVVPKWVAAVLQPYRIPEG